MAQARGREAYMNIAIAVLGGLIAFFSFLSGVAIYSRAKSAIHEIYAALLMITSVLGLVILAIGIAAATIRNAILRGQEQASSERRMLADALRAVAEHQRVG
jgi:hypothetical protein